MGGRVVVVGASMAGLLTARQVLEHADEVMIIERDALDAEGGARRGVPQGRHTHVLLAAGERRLERCFPGIVEELVAAGAVRGDAGDGIWYQAGALRVRQAVGISGIGVSRPLLESTVRHRLLAERGVRIERGVSVDDVTVHGGRVTGVVAGGDTFGADLVVDCSGRRAPLLNTLTAAGFAAPAVDAVHVGISYGTRILRRSGTDIGALFCVTAHAPPHEPRIGVLVAIEGDRWIVTLGGYHGDDVPTDDEGFLAYARSLPSPVIGRLLERAEPLGPVMTYRMATSQRRRVERLRQPPAG